MARSSFHYLKWNFVFEVQFTSVIRGHHIYKSVWTPTLGEKLNCREDDRKEAKQHDEYAIGTYLEAYTGSELVGHVPMELSYLIYTFLRAYDGQEGWRTDLLCQEHSKRGHQAGLLPRSLSGRFCG